MLLCRIQNLYMNIDSQENKKFLKLVIEKYFDQWVYYLGKKNLYKSLLVKKILINSFVCISNISRILIIDFR